MGVLPSGAYPFPVVEVKGYRFEAKSKAEVIENVRPWLAPGRACAAGFLSSRGSSSSKDNLREEAIPEREDVEEEEVRGPGELDAKLASSKESRALGCKLA